MFISRAFEDSILIAWLSVRLFVCGRLMVAEINPVGFCSLKVFFSGMPSECIVNLPVSEYKGIV